MKKTAFITISLIAFLTAITSCKKEKTNTRISGIDSTNIFYWSADVGAHHYSQEQDTFGMEINVNSLRMVDDSLNYNFEPYQSPSVSFIFTKKTKSKFNPADLLAIKNIKISVGFDTSSYLTNPNFKIRSRITLYGIGQLTTTNPLETSRGDSDDGTVVNNFSDHFLTVTDASIYSLTIDSTSSSTRNIYTCVYKLTGTFSVRLHSYTFIWGCCQVADYGIVEATNGRFNELYACMYEVAK